MVSKRRRLLRANRNPCHIEVNVVSRRHCRASEAPLRLCGSWRAAPLPDNGFVLPLLNSSLCGARMRTSRHIESCLSLNNLVDQLPSGRMRPYGLKRGALCGFPQFAHFAFKFGDH